MADRRRLVTLAYDGTVTTVRDLENGSTYYSVKDSFTVSPGQRRQVQAGAARRYAGTRAVAETHDNGSIAWKILVTGTTADAVIANVETILGDLEGTGRLFVEWRPEGITYSVYYEVRGPATWKPTYSWAQFAGARSMYVDVEIPVGPLAWGDQSTIAIASTSLPAVVSLGTAIPGDAPSLVDLELTNPTGGSVAPIWALIGWTKRPAAALAGSVAPFGIIEAETGGTVSGWASAADAAYGGGNGLKVTASGAGTASALFTVDPSVMQPDDFTPDEVDLEFWARVALDSTLVSPRLTLSLLPLAGSTFGGEQFSAEFGSTGKALVLPASGTAKFRLVRLGVLSLPVDTVRPLKWNVKVLGSWAAGSTGVFGFDRLLVVPARQRAVSISAKANDSAYGKFIGSTGTATKTIRSDLSGLIASGAGNPGRDCGLGGTPLELPPGNVDMLLKLSDLVADDPTSDATSEQLAFAGVTGTVRVTPRYWLGRGA